MKKGLLIVAIIVVVIGIVLLALPMFLNNGLIQNNEETSEVKISSVADNNENYYLIINGTKFNPGDKISDFSNVELKQDKRALDEVIDKETYLVGAGSIYNERNKKVFDVNPFNPTDSEITVENAVIGGIEIGETEYSNISEEVLALDIEVAGGIKLGSTYEELVNVFGETEEVVDEATSGYKQYTYKSSKTYRFYEFIVDSEGKVSKISWRNLVYND